MFELILLAVALSMDAFAVSVGLGTKYSYSVLKTAIWCGLYFGIFQGVMPLLGYYFGQSILGVISHYIVYLSFIILFALGIKMIYQAITAYDMPQAFSMTKETVDVQLNVQPSIDPIISQKAMLSLALATSIDAMAVGLTLHLLDIHILISCLLIALITAIFSFMGVFLGKSFGTWLENKAEILGGLILIGISIKTIFPIIF